MKIMIVEDDPRSLAPLEKTLRQTEPALVTACTGAEAWNQYAIHQPRIVVTDWLLPEISGLELCQRIRKHALDTYTYLIIMAAKDNKEDVLAAFDAGVDDFMAKPFDVRELQARINTGKRIIELEDKHQSIHRTLISSRNKFRTVFDALTEEIISVDCEMKIVSMNKSALSTRKGSFQAHINKPCCSLSEEPQSISCRNVIGDLVQKAFATQTKQFFIDRFQDEKGNAVIKEHTALPVMDDDGRVMTVTVVSRDVTESHQRNEEIKNLNEKLRKISSELIKKNLKLEKALENLERTQAQMLRSEKMASIGQLAAGVAHEINNPTGFVSSNLQTLSDYQQDFSQLIEEYQQLKTTLRGLPADQLPQSVSDLLTQVETTEENVDIAYIKEDVNDLISDCREGTERIKKIVQDLKHFAHPGEDKLKETDINSGIVSTLNVAKNELKYKATIVKDLGQVPIIQAHPQQLNQVFMNILVNAAQAIEKTGEIHITTATVDGMVEIRISDTGCGIPKENLNKIFDPFFTTKDVGKGTGLGMNIAYNIINKHDGDIQVESELGKGTTFIMRLPVLLPSEEFANIPGDNEGLA
jgi:signal transduction histidine kinase/DNA-binding response OmpR family regulator